ncbi:MAG: N-acetylmuramoyl-L-alanine amidase, partial [Flavobacteriaceae bacterium]|nr:N-acetylmuramoyl-L-alanine amidase [Flavobacteriaceae bacterium]
MKTKLVILILISIIVTGSFSFAQNENDKKFVVVLDAGHGGKDPGNLGNGYKEKDIALKVVLDIGKEIEKNKRYKVIYT